MKSRRLSVMSLIPLQSLRVPGEMLGHERRDEIIAVVVSPLAPKRQRDAGRGACLLQQLGAQFLFDERVRIADVDEDLAQARSVLDQRDCIMLAPRRLVGTEIARQRLL